MRLYPFILNGWRLLSSMSQGFHRSYGTIHHREDSENNKKNYLDEGILLMTAV